MKCKSVMPGGVPMALVPRHPGSGRIGPQYPAENRSGGVTRPARVSGVKKLLAEVRCGMVCGELQTP